MGSSLRLTVGLVVFGAFTLWITWRAKTFEIALGRHRGQETALEGKQAPPFRLTSLEGRSVSDSELRGNERLVVAFWASWCQPCRTELPVLAKLYRRAHPNGRYEIVAISTDEATADAQRVAAELRLPFTVLLDSDGAVSRAYGVEAIPSLFVIDRDGKVAYVQVGLQAISGAALARELGIENFNPLSETDDAPARH